MIVIFNATLKKTILLKLKSLSGLNPLWSNSISQWNHLLKAAHPNIEIYIEKSRWINLEWLLYFRITWYAVGGLGCLLYKCLPAGQYTISLQNHYVRILTLRCSASLLTGLSRENFFRSQCVRHVACGLSSVHDLRDVQQCTTLSIQHRSPRYPYT